MTKSYKFYNITLGWIAFAIALTTYLLTVEPTVSFWDCGEFISSSYKLEVGHPPGAPLFMLLGRFFSIFSPNLQTVALMINMVSVLASAFTILFLFWTITHLTKKIITNETELTIHQSIIVLGSGFVGALAYTFSDTFWFSAVEAEVYATSSFFTAIVFWAILKWESEADNQYSNRWIILIAYLMGLSIGVHLLNLLAIPAIVFVYYFRKHTVTGLGIFITSLISIAILAFVMYGIIPGAVEFAAQFELIFVNKFKTGFNTGLVFYVIFLFSILALGIYITHKMQKVILNTILLSITVILIGYTSFAVIVIRSIANTPMNENQPDNAFSLLSYLNREQYGDRPLFYGPYYDAEYLRDENNEMVVTQKQTYIKHDKEYIQINRTNPEYHYESKDETVFPRMYSKDDAHVSAYKTWGNVSLLDDAKPGFSNNILFFVKYQLGQMYFRYFMWNFSGRQNDLQGYGNYSKGNWITGIPFIDKTFIGDQKLLPQSMKDNKSRNSYFLLPLILGFIGLFYSLKNGEKTFTVISLLFFFTGIAIVLYLNQTPYQPRERDYAYAGSFYAFAIWIGLGVAGISKILSKYSGIKIASFASVFLGMGIPVLMASQNMDDHNRSGRYTARDFAKNYLNSCEKNAILFTYGDNDTFPLWYLQEVEGFRTDIRVVNLSLLGTDWYINQMRRKAYDSDPISFNIEPDKYRQGKRDAVYMMENTQYYLDEKYFADINIYKPAYDSIQNRLINILQQSKYAVDAKDDFDALLSGKQKLTPIQSAKLIDKISTPELVQQFGFDSIKSNQLKIDIVNLLDKISSGYLPLKDAMDFMAVDEDYAKLRPGTPDEINFLPAKKFTLSVDKNLVKQTIEFSDKEKSQIIKTLKWNINRNYLYKNDWAALEIIARNDWKRPIYFSTSVGLGDCMGLQEYFRLEGFAYRLVPVADNDKQTIGHINTDRMYDVLMNKCYWGGMKDKNVLIENNNLRVISILEIRETFARLAGELNKEGKYKKAEEVIDRVMQEMPDSKIPYGSDVLDLIENYYIAGNIEKANQAITILAERTNSELKYYESIGSLADYSQMDRNEAKEILARLLKMTKLYKQTELYNKISQ